MVAVLIASFFFLAMSLRDIASGSGSNSMGFVVMFLFGGLMVAVFIAASRYRKRELARLYRFTQQNNAQLIVNKVNPGYAGCIFEEGDNRVISEAVVFPDGKEIGNYQYTKGSGKNRRTFTWGYMRVKLVRRLPHMLLDAKKNNLFGTFSNLPSSFSKNQTIKLEGNFNEHFTLYAPVGYEQDAFYVFTPDVMSALIDFGALYDIEVVDDSLIFYSTMPIRFGADQVLQKAHEVLDKISTELIDQGDYYADANVGNRAANIIAEPGRRLKSRFGFVTLFLVIIFILFSQASTIYSIFLTITQQ